MKTRIGHMPRLAILALLAAILSAAIPFARAEESNAAKARDLVNAAINMTDSNAAVKLLWQATEIDPHLADPYVYLGAYYNSRSDFENMIKVSKKEALNVPSRAGSAYLNIGDAYESLSPPRLSDALAYYRKAFALDPKDSSAALRIGEALAQQGNHEGAVRFLRLAIASGAAHPAIVAEAKQELAQLGVK